MHVQLKSSLNRGKSVQNGIKDILGYEGVRNENKIRFSQTKQTKRSHPVNKFLIISHIVPFLEMKMKFNSSQIYP